MTMAEVTTTHTPGPWNVLEGVHAGGGLAIGPVLDGIGPHAVVTFNSGESEANARLIAAAPDLLFALRELNRAWDATNFPVSDRMDAALDAADAAIAKAEGR